VRNVVVWITDNPYHRQDQPPSRGVQKPAGARRLVGDASNLKRSVQYREEHPLIADEDEEVARANPRGDKIAT
jgi:hypothetical protein